MKSAVYQYSTTVNILIPSEERRPALRAINFFHIGKESIELDETPAKIVVEAHYKLHTVQSIPVIVTVFSDGTQEVQIDEITYSNMANS
jgi:hypothetical protein